ncbi:hypothetical protein SANT12839_024930 [Streptomyces antimycoticus]|uniref:Uncharacterized protein n=1 Tax=Streptomyces antimycoticus TaxID=68175 RepID=A0A4D4JXQ6_9ACTN|nr:hypothetical protein [Streptomyces antimycoticus]GDY41611.1 hypothetical protein SANT12839_024930 [Streptomyces antimycoticus]
MVNPTLVTPGPQPLQAGPPVDEAQVLRSEVIGPRHARRRPVDNRRKAAAGAILLSATGAATALFMLMGKDAREATAASGHDTSTAVPDEPESHTVPYVEAAVGDTPLRGARAEKPKPQQPAAQPVAQAPAADPTPDKPRTPSAGKGRSTPSWPGWSSRGRDSTTTGRTRWRRSTAGPSSSRSGSATRAAATAVAMGAARAAGTTAAMAVEPAMGATTAADTAVATGADRSRDLLVWRYA